MNPFHKLLQFIGKQSSLRFGARDKLIRLFDHPDSGRNEKFEVEFFGHSYPGNFNTFIDWSTFYFGCYSEHEMYLIEDLLAVLENATVLDIGANVGHHSLFFSGRSKQVHSFEPYSPVAAKLREKITRNKLENVILHEVGLGQLDQTIEFYPPATPNTGTGSFIPKAGIGQTLELSIRNGDGFLNEICVSHVDFIKMDIEGYEVAALQGLRETLETSRPAVFFEWTAEFRSNDYNTGKFLFPQDYHFYELKKPRVFMTIFARGRYRLDEIQSAWPDENILALPKELLDLPAIKRLLSLACL